MNNNNTRSVIVKTIPSLLQQVENRLVFENTEKLYDKIHIRNLSYEEALTYLEKGLYITREEWDGFHFKFNCQYAILLKDRSLVINPDDVYNKDSRDWCVVDITNEALNLILQYDKDK